jgi:hypothetical protein
MRPFPRSLRTGSSAIVQAGDRQERGSPDSSGCAGSVVTFELTESGEVVLRPVAIGRRRMPAGKSRIAGLRGRATVKMRTEEILALTRGRR